MMEFAGLGEKDAGGGWEPGIKLEWHVLTYNTK